MHCDIGSGRTFVELLDRDRHQLHCWMAGDGDLHIFVISCWHPHAEPRIIHHVLVAKVKNIIEHGIEAVRFLRWDVTRLPRRVSRVKPSGISKNLTNELEYRWQE